MDAQNLSLIVELLLIAVTVAVAVKYIHLPYTVALVLVGLLVGFTDIFGTIHLSREVILFVFLPPLLFEGTLNMNFDKLRHHAWYVGSLAIFGTFISTIVLGALVYFVTDFPLLLSMLLGAIITPTDPVSVLATFKEHGVNKGLSTIVEGESVFNDGIGVVIVLILLQFVLGADLTFSDAIKIFLWEVFIAVLIGMASGYLTHLVLSKIDDHPIEVIISLILAYGSYLLAERFHASGVVAVVCAGLIIGNYGQVRAMSPRTRLALSNFWEIVSFGANSLLFLMIGMELDSPALLDSLGLVLLIFATMILARSFTTYLITTAVGQLFKNPIPWAWRHIINWGGLRGSIPIALALGLPANFPERQQFIVLVFGVVFMSLMVQGLSIKPLLQKLGLTGLLSKQAFQYEQALAGRLEAKAALRELVVINQEGEISDSLFAKIETQLKNQDIEQSKKMHSLLKEHDKIRSSLKSRLGKRLKYAQLTAIQKAYIKGRISEETMEHSFQSIEASLEEGRAFGDCDGDEFRTD